MSEWIDVCRVDDLEATGAYGFAHGEGAWPLPGFVVRGDDGVHAYENRCPHAGHRLDWAAHRFMDRARSRILCASHGAVFEPASGVCVGGPCPGERLRRLPARVTGDGRVQVDVAGWRWERPG